MLNKILLGLLVVSAASLASARPYYFMFEQPAEAPQAPQAPQAIGQQVGAAGEQLQAVAGQPEQLPKRIHGHLSELYSHGSNAVRGVVDQVQPDLKNIGKDISEAYAATRDNVGRRIEPIAQTVRPFLDHAQKVVAPYVNSAREEVPKMIKQAGPVLAGVGEKVRDGVSGFVDKMKSGIQNAVQPGQQQVQQLQQPLQPQPVQQQLSAAADSARSAVNNVIPQDLAAQQAPASA